jgi:hypothetical protein
MRVRKVKGQGATEYLLMLAAVLVIVAVAVYYVTRAGGYPAVSMNAEVSDNNVKITVLSGSIATGEWQFSVQSTEDSHSWEDGTEVLDAPSVVLGSYAAGTWYVNIKHIDSGHIYFTTDQAVTVV